MDAPQNNGCRPEANQQLRHLVVIHGAGVALAESTQTINELLHLETGRDKEGYTVPRRQARAVRMLLMDDSQNPVITAFQKAVLANLLAAPPPGTPLINKTGNESIKAGFVLRYCASFGIPLTIKQQQTRSRQLRAESESIITQCLPALQPPDNTAIATEVQWMEHIKTVSGNQDLVDAVLKLRDVHETGGDLDTVASAVFYGWWLSQARQLQYGRDWRFVFLNYHESLFALKDYAHCRLYMADLPAGAFPDLPDEIRALAKQYDISVARFEDHHPFTAEQQNNLKKLQDEKLIGYLALSGPLQGTEQPPEEWRCGADMVHASTLENTAADNEAARTLRNTAHAEDFVTDRTPLGEMLTTLIKGGFPKIELAECLLQAIRENNIASLRNDPRLTTPAGEWDASAQKTIPALKQAIHVIHVAAAKNAEPPSSAMGYGSDMPEFAVTRKAKDSLAIYVIPAVRDEQRGRSLPVGRACELLAKEYPAADYLFYCYGTDLLVARRLNNSDTTFNLGSLMPQIGHAGDGGHTGAAVCRPSANPDFPQPLFSGRDNRNPGPFAKYLAFRLAALGFDIMRVEDCSEESVEPLQQGGRRILLVLAAALAIGIALAALLPSFHPDAIYESNRGFFRQVEQEQQEDDNLP